MIDKKSLDILKKNERLLMKCVLEEQQKNKRLQGDLESARYLCRLFAQDDKAIKKLVEDYLKLKEE